jgi:meso-butanediol dehydrogenase / (S,S)-butanediol dehydrogenase / diacetyl reductase
VIVTGGSQGIGAGIVERFVADGANVVIADVADASRTLAALEKVPGGSSVRYIRTDVTDFASMQECVAETASTFGGVDVLVNNAGAARFGDIESVSFDDWHFVMELNVTGMFHATRAALPELRKTRGSIVSTASISGMGVNYSLNAYFAAKGAIVNLTRYLGLEYGRDGIRANAVAPGPINSHPGPDSVFEDPELVAYYEKVAPLEGRVGAVDDLPGVYSFLASDDARWITGQTIVVDGGLTLWTGEYDLGPILKRLAK